MGKLTIQEVAQLAGVSTGTVSRVLNGRSGVSDRTRAEVLQVVRRTGFVPDVGARRLARAQGGLVGVAPYNDNARRNPYYSLLLDAIQETVDRHGMRARVLDPSAVHPAQDACVGFILPGLHLDDPRLGQLAARGVTAVAIGRPGPGSGTSWVDIDNASGMAQAMRHLLSLGHRRVAHLTGAHGGQTAATRLGAYRAALAGASLPPDPALELDGGFTELGAYRAVRAALDAGVDFTAVAAASDEMALGALAALRDAGKHVPRDCSVTGFDDLPLGGEALTTVRQPVQDLGVGAATLLLERLGGEGPRSIVLPTTLVVRATTGPAPPA